MAAVAQRTTMMAITTEKRSEDTATQIQARNDHGPERVFGMSNQTPNVVGVGGIAGDGIAGIPGMAIFDRVQFRVFRIYVLGSSIFFFLLCVITISQIEETALAHLLQNQCYFTKTRGELQRRQLQSQRGNNWVVSKIVLTVTTFPQRMVTVI